MDQQTIRDEAWRRGLLRWKLRDYQKPIYDAIRKSNDIQYLLNCSRRLGKTTILCIIALEEALRTEDGMYQFTTSTGKAMRGIVRPIFQQLLEDCPEDIRPQWKGSDDYYYFPTTGSEIHLAGANNGHEDDSRGRRRNKCFVDEGQSVDRLEYLIDSVLLPQTIDQPGGQVLIAGTPPESPAHYYKSLYHKLKIKQAVSEYDIYSNTSLSQHTIDTYAEEAGGYESTAFRREYMCEFVVETERAVCPEWSLAKDKYFYTPEQPDTYHLYHKYVAMDVGGVDFTAILFGYYDFREARLVVEREWQMAGHEMTTDIIHTEVDKIEKELWGNAEPYRRISDNNNKILLNDLNRMYDTVFISTRKDNLMAQVNKLREWVKTGRLIITNDCPILNESLKAAIWDKNRKEFERMGGEFGHFDHVAALIYMIRNIDEWSNPIPQFYKKSETTHFIPPKPATHHNKTADTLAKIAGVHNRKKKKGRFG